MRETAGVHLRYIFSRPRAELAVPALVRRTTAISAALLFSAADLQRQYLQGVCGPLTDRSFTDRLLETLFLLRLGAFK